jgi:tetratricopeptide (TPR) repeat protein
LTANKKGGKLKKPALQGDARATKLTMAQDFRDKANKCMQTSFFTKPDPVAASTYYKRAADAYQQVGDEDRMERLYRLESAKCNMQIGAWASAATDYTRAAVLLVPKDTEVDDLPEAPDYPTIEKRRTEASMYHKQASLAYAESKLRNVMTSLVACLDNRFAH